MNKLINLEVTAEELVMIQSAVLDARKQHMDLYDKMFEIKAHPDILKGQWKNVTDCDDMFYRIAAMLKEHRK